MVYEVLIYVGKNIITALDITDDKQDYISMNGNFDHPANDVKGFYENLLHNYNVDELSDFNVKIKLVNGGTCKDNIKYLNNKFSEADEYSLWRVEEILPIIGLQKKLLKINSELNLSLYDRSYILKSDNRFNITVESIDEIQRDEAVNLTLKDFEILINDVNGCGLSYYDEWIKAEEELKKTIKQKEKYKKMCGFDIGGIIEFGNDRRNNKPLKWKVVKKDIQDNSMIIMCNNYRDRRKFSENCSVNSWEESDLRKWLNTDFFKQSFNAEEINRIDLIDGDRITIFSLKERQDYGHPMESPLWTRTVKIVNGKGYVYMNDSSLSCCDSEHYFYMILKYKF